MHFSLFMVPWELRQNNKAYVMVLMQQPGLWRLVSHTVCGITHAFSSHRVKAPRRTWWSAIDERDVFPWIPTHVLIATGTMAMFACVWHTHVTVHLPSQHAVTVSTGA